MPQRWKLTIEYDGRDFAGWQRQAEHLSVQGAIEDAIKKFSGEDVTLHVAGRTDAGVHALAQVAHVDLEKPTDAHTVENAINFHLRPLPVSILAAQAVPEDFHARFSAKARRYLYRIVNRRAPLAIERGLAWHYPLPLELEPMREAAALLPGHHDFSTFRAANCQASGPLRTLDQLDILRDGEEILVHTSARSFLYHQVRNMVGTLLLVGSGKWSVADFAQAFAACNRALGGPTAPPDGLYFTGALY